MATLGLPGVQKVNGAAYPGVWVEKQVTFIKISFSSDISALPAASLKLLGTATAVGAGTVADGTFAVVESVLVQALKTLELDATVLGISAYNKTSFSVDVMLGFAEGWIGDAAGDGLVQGFPSATTGGLVGAANAIVTTAATAAPFNTAVGQIVSVAPASPITFGLQFAYLDGSMPVANVGNGALELIADGNGPGSAAAPMGAPGSYPVDPFTA